MFGLRCPSCNFISRPEMKKCQRCGYPLGGMIPQEYSDKEVEETSQAAQVARLEALKKVAGEAAVGFAYATETEWICICGTHNVLDKTKQIQNCTNCHRNRDFVLTHCTEHIIVEKMAPGKIQGDEAPSREKKEGEMAEKLTGELEMLEGEEKITHLSGLQLTNRRLAYTAEVKKGSETSAAMIEDVDSVMMRSTRPSVVWVIIGAILGIIGIAALGELEAAALIPILIGAVMVILFFLLRKRVVQFTIAGTAWLTLSVRQLGKEEMIADFVNKFFEVKARA